MLVLCRYLFYGIDDRLRDLCTICETIHPHVPCCRVNHREKIICVLCECRLERSPYVQVEAFSFCGVLGCPSVQSRSRFAVNAAAACYLPVVVCVTSREVREESILLHD